MKMKKIFGAALVGVALLCASCNTSNGVSAPEAEEYDYVTYRSNSEIEMLCSDEGKVVEAEGLDNEGEEVLDNIDIEGKNVTEAVIAITTKSIELGFLDPVHGDQTIFVGVVENEETGESELQVNLESIINKYLADNKINVKVSKDNVSVYAGSASKWGVSEVKMSLIDRVISDNPELEISALVDVPMGELIAMVKNDMVSLGAMSKEEKNEYKNRLAEIKKEYDEEIETKELIDSLLNKLECATINEDTKALIQIELSALVKVFNNSKYDEYKAELKALKDEFSIRVYGDSSK